MAKRYRAHRKIVRTGHRAHQRKGARSVMSIIFRFTERGDGGAFGPTRSEPPSIDREKRCFRLKFITPDVTS